MRFPWQPSKAELRVGELETQIAELRASYDHQLIAALHQAALGEAADVAATSPVQAAAGLLGRCLAAATVAPETNITAAITPSYRYDVGSSLVLRGEHVSLLEVVNGAVRLTPACDWEISGATPYKADWTYKLQLAAPNGEVAKTVGGNQVVHIRIPDGRQPWQGSSPLASASITAEALGELEDAVRDELKHAARATLVSVPGFEDSDPDDDDDAWTAYRSDVANADSKTLLAPAPATQIQGIASSSAPPSYGVLRLRPEIPEELQTMRDRLAAGLYAALGLMPQLFDGGEATGVREAKRSFWSMTLYPLGRLISDELAAALEAQVELGFERLQFGNLLEASRVAKGLVDAGMEPAQALEAAGLS